MHRIKQRQLLYREGCALLAFALLVGLLRLPSLEQPFDNDSGANAYHARLILRGEPLYSTHHPAHHLPAIYYTYALAFYLFGDSLFSVKLMVILWTIITTYLVYGLGLRLRNRTAGLLGAVFYAVLSSHVGLLGSTAEIELFANLPRAAAVLVVAVLIDQRAGPRSFALVGALAGVAFLFKAVYLSPLIMIGLAVLADLWKRRRQPGIWQSAIRRGLWTIGGFAAVLLVVVAYFAHLGLLSRFLLVFELGTGYIMPGDNDLGIWTFLVYPIVYLTYNNIALGMLSLVGLIKEIVESWWPDWDRSRQRSAVCLLVPAWFVTSLAEAGASRAGYSHYYLLVVPPLVLPAAAFVADVCRDIAANVSRRAHIVPVSVFVLLLVPVFVLSGIHNLDYYYYYAQYRFGSEAHEDFVREGVKWGSSLITVQRVADHVTQRTAQTDHIYYWSANAQIYYVADRRCAIDIIWPRYAGATGPPERIFSSKTKYVILGESNNIPRPDWLYRELHDEYVLEETIDEQKIYRRTDA